MLSRARSALPGMAVAALLAGPAFAPAALAADPAGRKPVISAPIISDSALETVWRQSGVASWYGGKRWQGKRTASGARYDERQLTAAHATLPIGTVVRVTLEGTDRSVIVVINDRPGTRTRIIDLSRQAAANLGILSQGIGVVSLTALRGG
ncbi:MAG: septal ring lytic transglycosylase RlpA family protein [Alphaproteobacteria bacterium]|nr:septal ring lytic transglycosylase RlpA family protein [Alphaproteobacteria bacterium]